MEQNNVYNITAGHKVVIMLQCGGRVTQNLQNCVSYVLMVPFYWGLDNNIESVTLNNTFFNIVKIVNTLF